MSNVKSDSSEQFYTNNIWNRYGFAISGIGEKCRMWAIIKHMKNCLRWSVQRICWGYCEQDVWNMYGYLQKLFPDMLQYLKNHRHGSPAYIGKNYMDHDGIWVNDTCHKEWNRILDRMIFLWRETAEETCMQKNSFEEEFWKAELEFTDRYGLLGEKLQTEEELEANRKRGGGGTVHLMNELPEYRKIYTEYMEEERRLEKYRESCKDEVMDMMKEYFFSLWD